MVEGEKLINRRSTILLILAIVVAALVVIWIIISFNNYSNGGRGGISQEKVQKIMVADTNILIQQEI